MEAFTNLLLSCLEDDQGDDAQDTVTSPIRKLAARIYRKVNYYYHYQHYYYYNTTGTTNIITNINII